MMRRPLVVATVVAVAMVLGCVAQVRDVRRQTPFFDAPEGTGVALVAIDVPEWVRAKVPDGDDPVRLLRTALQQAFDDSPYLLVDRIGEGAELLIGPDLEPIVIQNASRVAVAGRPFEYNAAGRTLAYGAPPVRWEIVSGPRDLRLNDKTGEVRWTPQEEGRVSMTIAARNRHGENRYSFEVEVVEDDVEIHLRSPQQPTVGPSQRFTSSEPSPLPAPVVEPLVLAAHVVSWKETTEPYGNRERRKVTADVVYSLWTRHGKEVETRRVTVSAVPQQNFATAPTMVPEWSSWKRLNWESDSGYRPRFAPMDEEQLFACAADVSARAFAYPYGNREVHFSAQLEDDDALEEGLEHVKEKDWEAAYKSFAAAAEANPDLAGAYYNMGVMRELQGRTAEAVGHYEQAVELDDKGMYRRQRDAASRRLAVHKDLTDDLAEEAASIDGESLD